MLELIAVFKEQINTILGALVAYLGFYVQASITARQTRSKLFLEKVERCYMLCQAVYDGHKREIANARKHYQSNKEIYSSNRKHPGQEMSELRMLLRCYVPDLVKFEPRLDDSHKVLKDDIFKTLDDVALKGGTIPQPDFEQHMIRCQTLLEDLASSTSELKQALAERAQRG